MNKLTVGVGLLFVFAAAALGFWLGKIAPQNATSSKVTENNPANEKISTGSSDKKILYWYDPMQPQQHFDVPGKSPFMDMDLVPKYAGDNGENNGLKIDSQLTQNIGLRLATAEKGELNTTIDAVGTLTFNARDLVIIQARTNGFVERVYARAPGDTLKSGDPLVDLLVPEWAGAQLEFISLLSSGETNLINAARERLRLSGMTADLIKRIEQTRKPQTIITIKAPNSGVIQTLEARTGMTILAGQTLASLNGLETVWLEMAIPESQAALIQTGQAVRANFTAYPGETVTGQVISVLPETNSESRTLRVRSEIINANAKLKPGMYAQASIQLTQKNGGDTSVVLVPSEAIIRTGKQNLVMVASDNGRYQPTEVTLGAEANGKTVVLNGLKPGQQVVASGQFLIDSEANLNGVIAKMVALPEIKWTEATLIKYDKNNVTLEHGDIPEFDMPAMTMPYPLSTSGMADTFVTGEKVEVRFEQRKDDLTVVEIRHSEAKP